MNHLIALLSSLQDLESSFGSRRIAVARELTKIHEEIWRGTIPEAVEYFTQNEPRGEFTLVIAGNSKPGVEKWSEDKINIAIKSGLKLGESPVCAGKTHGTGERLGEKRNLQPDHRHPAMRFTLPFRADFLNLYRSSLVE